MKVQGEIYNYNQYIDWLSKLVAEGKTSGKNQTMELIQFTALNLKRMQRLNKTIILEDSIVQALATLKAKQTWYVIAEVWCGDCAQNLPLIGKLSELSNGNIDLKIIQRDENPEWINKYNTLGAKAIPKLISFNKLGHELFSWGSRPKPAQELLNTWKENKQDESWQEFETKLHTWYAKDKTQTQQNEILELLLSIKEVSFTSDLDSLCFN